MHNKASNNQHLLFDRSKYHMTRLDRSTPYNVSNHPRFSLKRHPHTNEPNKTNLTRYSNCYLQCLAPQQKDNSYIKNRSPRYSTDLESPNRNKRNPTDGKKNQTQTTPLQTTSSLHVSSKQYNTKSIKHHNVY